jgi:HTH-type transcriptional regulator/antitoxin HigA
MNTTATSGKTTAKAKFNPKKYAGLLAETLPEVIETVSQNRRMIKILDKLTEKGANRTPEETKLARLLGRLIQDFEMRYYKPQKFTPREMLIGLMEMNNLKQADLLPVFGSSGIASEVINGKREISKAHAKALAKFFNTSTDLFL